MLKLSPRLLFLGLAIILLSIGTLRWFGTPFKTADLAFNLAPLPPMGWNGWNAFRCSPELNEESFKAMVDIMVSSGMKDVGYTYVNLDDCWQVARAADGSILADETRFPSGIKALAEYVHQRGLKFGIYTSGGRITCEGRPGSYGYEKQDVQTYAEWGVDFIKIDWCGIEFLDTQTQYALWREAVEEVGRPMVLSIAIAAIDDIENNKVWLWGRENGHMWRTARDIQDHWPEMLRVLDKNALYPEYNGPNGWNHADMLEVGNGHMTLEEYKTHFTMWSMMATPLLAGNDLRTMSEEIKAILTHSEVIAINQDPLGKQARLLSDNQGLQVWVKDLTGFGQKAIVFLNRQENPADIHISWSEVGLAPAVWVYDVWDRRNESIVLNEYTARVPAHGVKLMRVSSLPLEPLGNLRDLLRLPVQTRLVDMTADTITKTDDRDVIDIDRENSLISMTPLSDMKFNVNRRCSVLTAQLSVDQDHSPPHSSLLFKVYGDGHLLYESLPVGYDDEPAPMRVDIRGVEALNFFVMPATKRAYFSQVGQWKEATITCKGLQ